MDKVPAVIVDSLAWETENKEVNKSFQRVISVTEKIIH